MRWSIYLATDRMQLSIDDSHRWRPWYEVGESRGHWAIQGGMLRVGFRWQWRRV